MTILTGLWGLLGSPECIFYSIFIHGPILDGDSILVPSTINLSDHGPEVYENQGWVTLIGKDLHF